MVMCVSVISKIVAMKIAYQFNVVASSEREREVRGRERERRERGGEES